MPASPSAPSALVLGGGCFWCLDAAFQLLPGVTRVTCGYAGGAVDQPSYEQVYTDQTGHAEVVRVEFDPGRLTLEQLLGFFWQVHDPTQADGQGDDRGTRYRSVIFHADPAQRAAAEKSCAAEQATLAAPLTTQVQPLARFWPAEEYHQDYFARHPERAYCAAVIKPKIRKLQAALGGPPAPLPTMKRPPRPAPIPRTSANVPHELTFTAQGGYPDPFNAVVLDVVFTDPAGATFRVPAFWAGGHRWKARYASPLVGVHTYRTECTPATDAGLHGQSGSLVVEAYRGKNPLLAHGPVQVAADRRHFEHADGTPFFWLGDTWWMGLCQRLRWPHGFKQLTADRKRKGFNVVQIIAGLYPDMHAFDPRGANEAGFPWEEGYAHIRPEYFDAADKKLAHLVAEGITPCIVGAWGYFVAWMTEPQLKAHWRYLIARYGAWPVLWCTAGEANLPWYLAKNFPEDDRGMVKVWTRLMRYVHETDPFHRPVTIHPTAIKRYTARNATEDETLLDFDLLQVAHAQNESVSLAITAVRETYATTPRMPVINGEPCYEMLLGTITSPWPRRAFWSCVLNGAMGHTYGGNGIWQCNQPGIPHGASPHGGNYGNTPWQVAMHYPGSAECAHGKRLLTRLPWERFTPHPEWAAYRGDVWLPLDDACWIWPSRDIPPKEAPPHRAYFRRTFELPAGKKIAAARLRFAGVNHCEAQLNGAPAGGGFEWRSGLQFNDRAALLRPGRNALTLWCEHRPATGDAPGLLACLEVRFADGGLLRVVTDATWKAYGSKLGGCDTRDFDDTAWPEAIQLGELDDQPWGPITDPDLSLHGPQTAGIPGEVRITYVPYHEPIVVHGLPPRKTHRATISDPVTGRSGKPFRVRSDAQGDLSCAPPPGHAHDWVLVLETAP